MKRDISEQEIKKMIEDLPYYGPSSDFNDNVMSAIGFNVVKVSSPLWTIWIRAISGAAVAGWLVMISVLFLFLLSAYFWDILFILINPGLLMDSLKFCALKLAFGILNAWNFLGFVKEIVIILANRSNILFDLVFSTILAALTMMSVLKHSVYSNVEEKQ